MNARFSLAVHILCLLATSPGERLTSEFLAASIGTNPVVIRRLLGSLRRAGLVNSKSAGGGGWRLGLPAGEITLDLVHQAISVGETVKIHRNSPNPNCPVGKGVRSALLGVYRRADQAIDRELAELSVAGVLADVLEREQASA